MANNFDMKLKNISPNDKNVMVKHVFMNNFYLVSLKIEIKININTSLIKHIMNFFISYLNCDEIVLEYK